MKGTFSKMSYYTASARSTNISATMDTFNMSVVYTNSSPWYATQITQNYLDLLTIRPVSSEADDYFSEGEKCYNFK